MRENSTRGFSASSGVSKTRPEGARRHAASRAGATQSPGERERKMMREALAFLKSAEPGKEPEAVLKGLFALYGEIDRNAEYIRPGEREFFPAEAPRRTLERFLEGFKYVYLILKRAEERVRLANTFAAFVEKCRAYLGKCGYSEKFTESLLAEGGVFYRQSFNYWRTAFGDDEEGLGVMYGYFRACFGIIGNDDYCRVELGGREVSYDWRRMKLCRERLDEENAASVEAPYDPPQWEEWSEDTRARLRAFRERHRAEEKPEDGSKAAADAFLQEIRARNRERGLFQEGR